MVVAVGDTTTLVPVKLPGFQVYVCAPLAVRLAEPPTQIDGADAERFIVGVGFKSKATVCVDKQPNADTPVTVYTVVAVGVKIAALPVKALGFHV